MEGTDPAQSQVRLRLTSREQSLALENSAPILVPTSFRRYTLSILLNNLLHTEKPVPLEFLINGTYLRTTLEEYLTSNGISAETVLNVEYVRARLPPQYTASIEHDDWVSSIQVHTNSSTEAQILTSSYDGYFRLWSTSNELLAISPAQNQGGHSSFVKSARFVHSNQIASAGFDRTIKVWKYSNELDATTPRLSLSLELRGHKSSIDDLCTNHTTNRILSASSDHSVGIWSTRKANAPAVLDGLVPTTNGNENKRRKLSSAVSAAQRGPLALMQSHSGPVSGVIFDEKDSTVAYSSSWDQTVRTWDLVTASLVETRSTSHALFCVRQMPSLSLIASGSAGRDVKLVDPRQSATSIIAMNLKGHKNSVVALARDPRNEYTIASGSHDGTCRIWDVRSTRNDKDGIVGQSLYTLTRESLRGRSTPATGEGVKVLAVDWDADLGILTGGEDKMVQINRPEE